MPPGWFAFNTRDTYHCPYKKYTKIQNEHNSSKPKFACQSLLDNIATIPMPNILPFTNYNYNMYVKVLKVLAHLTVG